MRGFSYFSSYGCPEPCTFCCSPLVTNRRWKAIPGKLLAERMLEVHDRFKFNVMRFQDANFGVAEKRSNGVLRGAGRGRVHAVLVEQDCYEIETIDAVQGPSSLDLMQRRRSAT